MKIHPQPKFLMVYSNCYYKTSYPWLWSLFGMLPTENAAARIVAICLTETHSQSAFGVKRHSVTSIHPTQDIRRITTEALSKLPSLKWKWLDWDNHGEKVQAHIANCWRLTCLLFSDFLEGFGGFFLFFLLAFFKWVWVSYVQGLFHHQHFRQSELNLSHIFPEISFPKPDSQNMNFGMSYRKKISIIK